MMRDWENLRYFLAVARKGTVLGAANMLGVSHSTVLRRIEQFESMLNSKLFKKLQRGYELTSAGEELYKNSQSLEGDIERVLAIAEGRSDVTEGKLRISQPEFGILNVYPLYAEFRRQYPDIILEVHSTMDKHNVTQQEVDIVIRLSESPPDLLAGRCLGKVKAKAYASLEYLDSFPKSYTCQDLDWVIWRRRAENFIQFIEHEKISDPNIVLYAEFMPDVVSAVCNGMGVGFLSSHEAQMHDNLVELFNGRVVTEASLWILTHRELRNSERVVTFMRFMGDNLILE